jgi:hypothetical protein
MRKICEVSECGGYVASQGLCDKHRKRLARHGHIEATRPKDWGSREKHPLYSIWVGHRRYKTKHPLCDEWHKGFWLFVSGVDDRPSKDHHLRPINNSKPISGDNYHWVESIFNKLSTDEQKTYTTNWLREDRKRNPDKYKDKDLKKKYGIGLKEYKGMLFKQDGVCCICKLKESALNPRTKKARDLAVDHCHDTGKVRGLLCAQCNTGLGLLKDDISLLNKAIVYLSSNS